jgi:predicted RNase H-like HicB family nuclease
MPVGEAVPSPACSRLSVTHEREETGMFAPGTRGNGCEERESAACRGGRNALRQVMLMRAEGGHWVAECTSLPGCTGEGGTRERAIERVKESIANYLAELEESGLPVPEEHFDALIVAV